MSEQALVTPAARPPAAPAYHLVPGAAWRPYDALKRALDILVSGVGLVCALPVIIVIILAIYLEDGPPAFYCQTRVGWRGRPFRLFKFRSMVKDAEAHTGPVLATRDDPRVTRMGRRLRKTAMDELPQLINIFRGDMSFVGPRPERPELVARIEESLPEFRLREAIRPGLTGLAQVYGRYYTDPAEKLPLDLAYIKHRSLWLDIHLFLHSWRITSRASWDSDQPVR